MREEFQVDPTSAVYVYIQIADHVQQLIEAGTLTPGARLGSEIDMATEYGVARMTIRRVVRELRDRGLVVTVFGKGTYVTR
ncbi:MAG: winged helix-turn-helix domain-containing protein [Sporichthyaceae bacterium]|nr:winged helix-turn-helix domain-containing protein [Sporichthyaceae bacterium]